MWITVIKNRADTFRADLFAVDFNDLTVWVNKTFIDHGKPVNEGLAELKKLNAPASFSDIATQCRAIKEINIQSAWLIGAPGGADLASFMAHLSKLDDDIGRLKGNLDKLWGDLDNRIVDIARGVEATEQLFQACELWD